VNLGRFDSTPVPMTEYRRPLASFAPWSQPAEWGDLKPARYALQVVRLGRVSMEWRPNLARDCREEMRACLADVLRDAKRWGATVRIARVIERAR
jgi:hypothetical protein